MSSSNVPPFIDEHLKPVDDVKRREELEQMASKLYALKKDKCDEPKKMKQLRSFVQYLATLQLPARMQQRKNQLQKKVIHIVKDCIRTQSKYLNTQRR